MDLLVLLVLFILLALVSPRLGHDSRDGRPSLWP